MRAVLLSVALVMATGVSHAQTKEIRQAKPGESCLVSYNDCGGWCDTNKVTVGDKTGCKGECTRYHSICEKTGVWSTTLGKVEIRGLPPK